MIPERFDDRYDPIDADDLFYPSPRPSGEVPIEDLEDIQREENPGRRMTKGYRNWLMSLGRW